MDIGIYNIYKYMRYKVNVWTVLVPDWYINAIIGPNNYGFGTEYLQLRLE